MKRKLKKLLQIILKRFAIRLLRKFHPDIIAVTGSVGKTSTKDAIYEVLKNKFNVRKSEGNFNNEIGVPLTIIGAKSFKNVFAIFKNTFLSRNYPQILVLEMGADKKGDIRYLTSFIKPKIAVITRVACSHLEQFCDLEGVAKEKGKLVEAQDYNSWAVLNFDDENVKKMSTRTSAQVLGFGQGRGADILASDIKMNFNGLKFDVVYKKGKQAFSIPVTGKHQVYSALAGIACGLIYGLSLKEAANNIKNFKLSKNRTDIIKGIKKSVVINDVYNANPESMMASLDTLVELADKRRKVVVLGDMFELGIDSKKLHLQIGNYLKGKADVVVLAGEMMRGVFKQLKKEFASNIYWFSNSDEASKNIRNIIEENDIILVKGSRGMHMEVVVEVIKD